jgi:hypothetical protein
MGVDFSLLAGVVEKPSVLPAKAPVFTVASVDLSAVAGRLELPLPPAKPVVVEQAVVAPVPVQIAQAPMAPAPVQIALASPSAAPAAAAPVAATSDLARMRAEIEAEIARERERMAQTLQSRAGKQFRFGT